MLFCKKHKGGKLAMRYIGPYKITSMTKKMFYILQHLVSGKTSNWLSLALCTGKI